jgi:hypothetical protein
MDNPAPDGLGRDILNALGANLVAYAATVVLWFAIALLIEPNDVPIAIPFALYCLLVALYVRIQIRKGLKRRGVLAGCIAAIVPIVALVNLNIA